MKQIKVTFLVRDERGHRMYNGCKPMVNHIFVSSPLVFGVERGFRVLLSDPSKIRTIDIIEIQPI